MTITFEKSIVQVVNDELRCRQLSRRWLAGALGLSPGYLSERLSGSGGLDTGDVEMIGWALDIEPLQLLVQASERMKRWEEMNRLLADYSRWLGSWASPVTIEDFYKIMAARGRAWDLRTVTTEPLQDWLGTARFSDSTRRMYFSTLRSFFGWMHTTGRRDDDPTLPLRRPRAPSNTPRPLSPDEVSRLRENLTGDVRQWFLLALLAGLRAHEIAKIRGEDVTEEWIYVQGKGGKQAMIPTHHELWELAQAMPRTGFWYPGPHEGHVSRGVVTVRTGEAYRQHEITRGGIHRARHTYATNLLRGGANIRVVQTLMRHSSLATTAAYCAVDEDERRAAIRLLT